MCSVVHRNRGVTYNLHARVFRERSYNRQMCVKFKQNKKLIIKVQIK